MAFTANAGLMSPGHSFSVLTQRHMHLYGTKREHLAEIAISQRDNAIRRADRAPEGAAHARRLLQRADDLRPALSVRLHDGDRRRGRGDHHVGGAGARPPATARLRHGLGERRAWAGGARRSSPTSSMPDEYFASSGHRPVAQRMYEMAGVGPDDVDVALLYDHFSPMVLMQLEDYGFCRHRRGRSVRRRGQHPLAERRRSR